MRIAIALIIFWLATGSGSWAENCMIIRGGNDAAQTQNCATHPQSAALSVVGHDFENSQEQDGKWRHQFFVQIAKPINLFLAACGEGVVDVGGSPWPGGTAAVSDKVTRDTCVGHRVFKVAPGRWALWVITAAEDTRFTLHPVIQ